ncbi:hypothetical protein [Fervidibacillus albus]|uniref:Uncharacterized protein n=1 Tax=Fervidibacillus albus TaxID=2980026 RepID=A0A9E8RW06_9BACI|nr:hypothetical protein [Fervidibacillus albus]WAA10036.1 hypothetical protein OE104_01300 [Fervidibacillus albus]
MKRSTRKIAGLIYGIGIIIFLGYSTYKIMIGEEIGFTEIMPIGILCWSYFSTVTWGSREEKDGIFPDEELGQRITEKSAKIGYYVLLIAIFIALVIDEIINENSNVILLILMTLAMITLPAIEYIYSKKF